MRRDLKHEVFGGGTARKAHGSNKHACTRALRNTLYCSYTLYCQLVACQIINTRGKKLNNR